MKYSANHYGEEYLLHEKNDLQEVVSNKLHGKDVAIIKAQRIPREEDELNVQSSSFIHPGRRIGFSSRDLHQNITMRSSTPP